MGDLVPAADIEQALDVQPRKRAAITRTYQLDAPSEAIVALEKAMGGRKKLIEAVLHAGGTEDLAYVIGMIANPLNDARTLPDICASGGITVGELIEAFKRGAIAKAQVAAVTHVADSLPQVVSDVMVRAQPYLVECGACRGQGTVRDPDFTPDKEAGQTKEDAPQVPCEVCKATGQVTAVPELDRQKVALELGGLGPKRAPMVDMSDRRKVSIGDSSAQGFVAMLGAVDAFLHKRAAVRPGTAAGAALNDVVVDGDVRTDDNAGDARRDQPPPD